MSESRTSEGRASEGYRLATRVFAVTIVAFGVAILTVTLANGGGPASTGFLLGLIVTGLGIGRLYLAMRG